MITIVIPSVNHKMTEECLKKLKTDIQNEIIVVEEESFSYELCDISDKYNAFHLVVQTLHSPMMYEAIESIHKGEVIGFLDGDTVPCDDWVKQAYETHFKYKCKFVGGPVNIKTNKINIREIAQKKWPIQLTNSSKLYNNGFIRTEIPSQFIVSGNLSVKSEDFWKMNKQNIRIGRIGCTNHLGNGCYYIDDDYSIFNEEMVTTYEA